ncbi:SRPBCC family protein [Streptomyces sp. SID14478]|uniref:SRPBCC family protein n=1 Tax=Streptomyces sp. SID14478 TaxID=2706073 RepID=UPI0013DC0980|nr:SRPBCC family protein [Streptomyces sp. SID14478]NEB78850.1 SRPBCC family protein [Streptomyces sp. SID14478]
MSTEEFTRSVTVAAPAAHVFAHLADPENYVGLSPLVIAVRDVVASAERVHYVAVERFRLGPLRRDNPIRVTMTFPRDEREIVSEVRSPGRVRLTASVRLVDGVRHDDGAAGTEVHETIRVTYPRPLRALVVGQATKAQRHRLAELARRLTDAPTTDPGESGGARAGE